MNEVYILVEEDDGEDPINIAVFSQEEYARAYCRKHYGFDDNDSLIANGIDIQAWEVDSV